MAKKATKKVIEEAKEAVLTVAQEAEIQQNYNNMSEEEKAALVDPSELIKKESRKQTLLRVLVANKGLEVSDEMIKAIMFEVYPSVERERKHSGPTIAHTIIELMLSNAEDPQFTDEEIVAVVQQEFEGKKADKKHVAYYRSAINAAIKDPTKARHLNLLPVDEKGKPDLTVLPLVKVVLNSQNKKVVV